MSDFDRQEVLRRFSQEFLESEVQRVKSAAPGTVLYEMDAWENPSLADYVLETAAIAFHVKDDGFVQYIKGEA